MPPMRTVFLLAALTLAACGSNESASPTLDGVDPPQSDAELAPDATLQPEGDLAPQPDVEPDPGLAPDVTLQPDTSDQTP